jgi:ATP-binding cassette subfamily B protein
LHEFFVFDAYRYNQSGPMRWLLSHILRYKRVLVGFFLALILTNIVYNLIFYLTGSAFNAVLQGNRVLLMQISLFLLAVILLNGFVRMIGNLLAEIMAKRVTRDARAELYLSLLGKSQTFHNRQRVGDIMARASNDIAQLNNMMVPGLFTIFDSFSSLAITLIFIGLLSPQLLLFPSIYLVALFFLLYDYGRRLRPVVARLREQFSAANATLNEALGGIEVVKATSQEDQEWIKFERQTRLYRDSFVRKGRVQAVYLPLLLFSVALAFCLLHGLYLVTQHQFTIGSLVSFMGLAVSLRNPASLSIWAFELVQHGMAGARRVQAVLKEEGDLDENTKGYSQQMRGTIAFENVTFSYGTAPVLKNLTFKAEPGQTIAIVGQTGSGKSSLTKLVNRIYDVDSGRVLIDDVDVRDWSLDALRSQVSTIEQDIFLFSRSISENIAFGLGQRASQEAIEQAARDAQAHDFIMSFKDGYKTEIGERGITLSGGQRQRIAIARALLTDPRILILDDSTSAIDSLTEDEIQKAIRRVLEGRTTLLITHRLSQIRWADKILVLRHGELIDQGTHEDLLARCEDYRRLFVHYSAPAHSASVAGTSQEVQKDHPYSPGTTTHTPAKEIQ